MELRGIECILSESDIRYLSPSSSYVNTSLYGEMWPCWLAQIVLLLFRFRRMKLFPFLCIWSNLLATMASSISERERAIRGSTSCARSASLTSRASSTWRAPTTWWLSSWGRPTPLAGLIWISASSLKVRKSLGVGPFTRSIFFESERLYLPILEVRSVPRGLRHMSKWALDNVI